MSTKSLVLLLASACSLFAEHPSCYINLITIEGTVANQIRIQVRDQDAGTFTYTVHVYADDATKTSSTDVVNLSVAAGSNTTYAITGATFGTGSKNLQDGQQHTIYFSMDTQTLGTIAPAAGDAWLYKWNVAGGVADYSYPLYLNSGRGATAAKMALVFNPNDPYSVGVSGSTVCTVGGTAVKSDGVVGSYVNTWGVPCANVHKFATAWSSTTTDITATQFASDYAAITPAFSASEQYIALGFMLPVRVTGITATGNAGTISNEIMSITGAFANGGAMIAPATLTASGGVLAGGEHLQGNPMFRTASLTPFTTYGKRPCVMLAWAKCDGGGTGENCSTVGSTGVAGNWTADIATAQAGITAAKNAVNTNPTGGQIYVQSNSTDFGRSNGYGLASPLAFGNQTVIAPASLNVTTTALISTSSLITQTSLLGYELAAAGPSTASPNTPTMVAAGTAYMMARTSSSGMLAGGFQTPATWYLLKGAVLSAGAINEPYGLLSIRFPEMMLFQSRYTRGATAIEAAWASTRDPWETVFVGDPLASPFSVTAVATTAGCFFSGSFLGVLACL